MFLENEYKRPNIYIIPIIHHLNVNDKRKLQTQIFERKIKIKKRINA